MTMKHEYEVSNTCSVRCRSLPYIFYYPAPQSRNDSLVSLRRIYCIGDFVQTAGQIDLVKVKTIP